MERLKKQESKEQMLRENILKMDQSLARYAPAVVVFFSAFFVDKISDYTCDWWLNACVQMSSFLFFTYLAIAIFFIYMAYELHQSRGSVAAVNGLLALGQASTRLGASLAEQGRVHATRLYSEHVQPPAAAGSGPGEKAKSE